MAEIPSRAGGHPFPTSRAGQAGNEVALEGRAAIFREALGEPKWLGDVEPWGRLGLGGAVEGDVGVAELAQALTKELVDLSWAVAIGTQVAKDNLR